MKLIVICLLMTQKLLNLKQKCSGSCNNINDPYAKLCVPNVVKNINVRVFNLMSFSNQKRHIG